MCPNDRINRKRHIAQCAMHISWVCFQCLNYYHPQVISESVKPTIHSIQHFGMSVEIFFNWTKVTMMGAQMFYRRFQMFSRVFRMFSRMFSGWSQTFTDIWIYVLICSHMLSRCVNRCSHIYFKMFSYVDRCSQLFSRRSQDVLIHMWTSW